MVYDAIQIVIVGGGMTFRSRQDFKEFLSTLEISFDQDESWKDSYLDGELESEAEILRPRMPCKENAKYDEWEAYFDRVTEHFRDGCILIGNSLGGIFLAKYLSEHSLSVSVRSLYLIAAPFDDTLGKEDLAGGFELGSDLSRIEQTCEEVTLLYSRDDDVVPEDHAYKYATMLPSAVIKVFENMNGHFQISEFPDIVRMIKQDMTR
ncbi:MAG: alpha/beta hydrolase [Nanoarchaeota archaeon]